MFSYFTSTSTKKDSELSSKHDDDENESSGLIQKTREETEKAVKEKLDKANEEYSKPNYTMMIAFFGLGCLFLMASLTALPFVIISPSGFSLYFSMSSFCFLTSVSFYHGPCNYLKKLICNSTNLPISIMYIGSTAANLYFSLFKQIGYLYTMGMIAIQALSVAFFVLQTWTGGDNAQEKLKDFVSNGVQAGVNNAIKKEMTGMIMKGDIKLPL